MALMTPRAYEEIVEFIAAGTDPQGLIAFQPSAEAKQRVADLIFREKTTGLAPRVERALLRDLCERLYIPPAVRPLLEAMQTADFRIADSVLAGILSAAGESKSR